MFPFVGSTRRVSHPSLATSFALLVGLLLVAGQLTRPQHQAAGQEQAAAADALGPQAMAQMLQLFNGNDSNQMESNHFKVFKIYQDSVLVGAR